ncbi:MAG: ATP-binding protein [Actinomycetota bacterium]
MSLPLRVRLTLASGGATAAILAGLAAYVFLSLGVTTLRAVDDSLVSRADAVASSMGQQGVAFDSTPQGAHPDASAPIVQIVDANGVVLETTSNAGTTPLLPARKLSTLRAPLLSMSMLPDGRIGRIYAIRTNEESAPVTILVASSLSARTQTLHRLLLVLVIGCLGGLGLAMIVAWFLSGAALAPVERMRREAEAMSAAEPERRLSVPRERELRELGHTLNDMLERVEQARSTEQRLLDDASHELRTPLAILQGELDLARTKDRSREELEETVRLASQETHRLVRLAEDLLILARKREGRLPLELADISLKMVVHAACEGSRSRATEVGGQIVQQVVIDHVRADQARLRQVLDNLLDNALRASHSGGVILVSTRRENGWVSVSVEDNGPGFTPQMIDHVFDPFIRSNGIQHHWGDRDSSAGLGLSIVRAIADAHGGSAIAENRSEGGARVTILLPTNESSDP